MTKDNSFFFKCGKTIFALHCSNCNIVYSRCTLDQVMKNRQGCEFMKVFFKSFFVRFWKDFIPIFFMPLQKTFYLLWEVHILILGIIQNSNTYLRDHPCIMSANYWPFWTPPTHLISINTLLKVSKSGHFLFLLT